MRTDIVVKIDFKIEQSKKEYLREEANKLNVSMSYILQKLVDDHIDNGNALYNRKQVSEHLVNLLQASKYIKEDKVRDYIFKELEELQCQM